MSPYYQALRRRAGSSLLLLPGVAAVIRNGDGGLLLQEKAGGEWSLPAGAIEPGETPQAAVQREVREETGLIVDPFRIAGVFGGSDFRHVYRNGDVVEYTIILFHCRVLDRADGPIDAETISLRYFRENEVPKLALPYPASALFGGAPA
jgi:8-oxo-dGTP pyrophosphatase MutT (NUDIX family)